MMNKFSEFSPNYSDAEALKPHAPIYDATVRFLDKLLGTDKWNKDCYSIADLLNAAAAYLTNGGSEEALLATLDDVQVDDPTLN